MTVQFRSAAEVLAQLSQYHPNLARATWHVSSPSDDSYQCIAWAAGFTDRKAWPHEDSWWFPNCSRSDTMPEEVPLDFFIEGFVTLGYRPCDSKRFEFGYQKVVIYANELGVTHMARQHFLGHGWLSKLGDYEDIVHPEPEDVAGDMSPLSYHYGEVVQILKRSWWSAAKNLSLFRCFRRAFAHWLLRLLHPSWNRSRWNVV